VIENLNLASQPLRNRTFPWALAAVISLVSAAALFFTLGEYQRTRARAQSVESDVRQLRLERARLVEEASAVNQALTEEQRLTLDAAHLILDRKNFSWSRLFSDLESTLPQTVRVSRITVRDIYESGGRARAELELAVVGKQTTDVTKMMAEMARAGIFSADLLTEKPASRGETGVEATLRVRYTPSSGRPAAPAENTAAGAAARGGAGGAAERAEAR
jgi:Tfp pilus assembly protein PilN